MFLNKIRLSFTDIDLLYSGPQQLYVLAVRLTGGGNRSTRKNPVYI